MIIIINNDYILLQNLIVRINDLCLIKNDDK